METFLLTSGVDTRAGKAQIASRIGIGQPADTFSDREDLYAKITAHLKEKTLSLVFLWMRRNFLGKEQVWQLGAVVG